MRDKAGQKTHTPAPVRRVRVVIHGAVQGVGFRPFMYRLANDLGLSGWVSNTAQGVILEVEGQPLLLQQFLERLPQEKPPRSTITSMESTHLDAVGYTSFDIRESDSAGLPTALILPDIALCEDCLRELFNPSDRRYRYPFINCTNCGPRFTIIERLPYDRPNTSMRHFRMCGACEQEYHDPLDRRFHAQPIACPDCGPHADLWDESGSILSTREEAIEHCCDLLRGGRTVAVKGIGGFHLLADARSESAVQRLRRRKHREEKPFALMFPSIEEVEEACRVSHIERRLLLSPEAPIVLLQRLPEATHIAESVAPSNPFLGVMLPYSPFHHLLLQDLGFPVVATSGNISDEPICTDEREALRRLSGIADAFLVHNRPIVRHVDDSIVRAVAGREMVQRRARGYAPLPVPASRPFEHPILAAGAHMKNTIALGVRNELFLSQHIGDLDTMGSRTACRRAMQDFLDLFEQNPQTVVCDMHPDYASTAIAQNVARQPRHVQHHRAHVHSCMIENELEPPLLGVAWDGTGYGDDGTIWGGEFFLVSDDGMERCATMRSFSLPGGDQAAREPRRSALGLLFELFGGEVGTSLPGTVASSFSLKEQTTLIAMLKRDVNSPRTSSVGRLFDAVASIAGIRHIASFEAQAAMEVEFATRLPFLQRYSIDIKQDGNLLVLDWSDMIVSILQDVRNNIPFTLISTGFHDALAQSIVVVAKAIGMKKVALSGGCFQNVRLLEHTIACLQQNDFQPYWHQRIPTNDGGISAGQVAAAARALSADQHHRERLLEIETH